MATSVIIKLGGIYISVKPLYLQTVRHTLLLHLNNIIHMVAMHFKLINCATEQEANYAITI
jgi:hypothetical protein